MMKWLSFPLAVRLLSILLGLLLLFHLILLIGMIGFDYTPDFIWGGKVTKKSQLIPMEIFGLVVTAFCLVLVRVRAAPRVKQMFRLPVRLGLWLFAAYFVLNTVGNLLAARSFERYLALLTVVLAFLFLRLALEKWPIPADH